MPHAKEAPSKIVVYDAGRVRSEKDNDDYLSRNCARRCRTAS